MIKCVQCNDYYPSDVLCLDPDDRIVCQWCARTLRDTGANERKFKCEWCGEPGAKIGNAYASTIIVKCTKCHHEWMAVEDKESEPAPSLVEVKYR
jgi:hypothetical protein